MYTGAIQYTTQHPLPNPPQPQRPGHAAAADPMPPPPGLALIFACIFCIFSHVLAPKGTTNELYDSYQFEDVSHGGFLLLLLPQLSQLPQVPQLPQLPQLPQPHPATLTVAM